MTIEDDSPKAAQARGKALVPLVQACQACDLRAVTSLLKSATREQIAGADSAGLTALHAVAQSSAVPSAADETASCGCFGGGVVQDQCTAIVQALLAAGADPDAQDGAGCSALMVACVSGRSPAIEELMLRTNMKIVNKLGETALMVALRGPTTDGLQTAVAQMLKSGTPVNQAAADGQTALMYAAAKGRLKVVQMLLENGADANAAKDSKGRTAVSMAVVGKYTAVAAALLEAGAFDSSPAVVNQKVGKGGQTQLHLAAAAGDAEHLKELLAAKAIVSTGDDTGQRALHVCHEAVCATLLLERGAEANTCDNARNTPLHIAARRGYLGLVRVLLDNKAMPNVHNVHGSTPLHSALEGLCKTAEHRDDKACLDICALLLERGGDANAQDGGGYQPLDRAHKVTVTGQVTTASVEILDLLKSHGARLSLTFSCELDVAPGGRMQLLGAAAPNGGGGGGGGGNGNSVRSKSPTTSKSPSMNFRGMHVGRQSITVNKVSPLGGSLRSDKAPAANRLEMIFGGGRVSMRDTAERSTPVSRRNSHTLGGGPSRGPSENGSHVTVVEVGHSSKAERSQSQGAREDARRMGGPSPLGERLPPMPAGESSYASAGASNGGGARDDVRRFGQPSPFGDRVPLGAIPAASPAVDAWGEQQGTNGQKADEERSEEGAAV